MAVNAQQLQPRISGLESNATYMGLLSEDNKLTQQEDSITVVVESLREVYRADDSNAMSDRERIISLENELFELRAKKASVLDKLNVIEQEWVLNNIASPEPENKEAEPTILIDSLTEVDYIFESPNLKVNLSEVDYKNLIEAEKLESKAEELNSKFIVNYDNMLSLAKSYENAPLKEDADKISDSFNQLYDDGQKILDELNNTWGFIYDNKSFAYSMLMELLGFDDILSKEAELMRKSQAEISSKQQSSATDAVLRYRVQKSSMVEFEILVAEKLGLKNIADSLCSVATKLSSVEKISPKDIVLEERLFLLYEPIKFISRPLYTASNPIPETAIYDKGVVFRIYVGSFKTKQPASTFRNTVPISHYLNSDNRHCYYIGGFATFEEAEAAQKTLKKRGFRAPQIVMWNDGEERNLTSDPLSADISYRIEIIDAPILPEGAVDAVKRIAPNSSINKVGNDKFVIMSLDRSSQTDSISVELRKMDPQLKVSISNSLEN